MTESYCEQLKFIIKSPAFDLFCQKRKHRYKIDGITTDTSYETCWHCERVKYNPALFSGRQNAVITRKARERAKVSRKATLKKTGYKKGSSAYSPLTVIPHGKTIEKQSKQYPADTSREYLMALMSEAEISWRQDEI